MQVVEPGFGVPLSVSLLHVGTAESNYQSWVHVTKPGTTSGKWKGVHTSNSTTEPKLCFSLDACANGE